jgi:dTDP-4-amino-4,6-dideoxygalactose transaminase
MKMHKTWPLGDLPKEMRRSEFAQLREQGYIWSNPMEVVEIFEKKVAEFAGSKYAIAVDCCSHGIFLSLKYLNASGEITIPDRTYVSIPFQILHTGCSVNFENIEWSGIYQLKPWPVYDGAVRWHKNMYVGGFHVLSFQIKKRIPIGRGGMILTDDYDAYCWLKKACHDGRNSYIDHHNDDIQSLGWHYYMTPEDAARGILLMDQIPEYNEDSGNHHCYRSLSSLPVFKK